MSYPTVPTGCTYQGLWAVGTTYNADVDVVRYNGYYFIARTTGAGNTPPSSPTDPDLSAQWERILLEDLPAPLATGTVPAVGTGPVNAVAASQTVTIAVGQPADGNTVVINGRTYTFKTALSGTPTPYEVLIGSDNVDSALNLKKAINAEAGAGVKYGTGTVVHPTVSAAVASNVLTLSAKTKGVAGNALTLTKTGANISVGGATFAGGVDGSTTDDFPALCHDGTYLYVALAANTIADANWRRSSLGGVY